MRRPAVLATLAVLLAGLVGLAVKVLDPSQRLAFSLGVPSNLATAELRPNGRSLCQTPIEVPAGGGFDRVTLALGTFSVPRGPEVELVVRDLDGGSRPISRGRLPGGYPDIGEAGRQSVRVDRVPAGRRVAVCLVNRGRTRVAVYGATAGATPSVVRRGSRLLDADLDLRFFDSEPRSIVSIAPEVVARAALFRPGWVGGWTYWLLGFAVLLLVPAALVRAVRSLD